MCRMKLLIYSQTSMVQIISSHTLVGIYDYFSRLGLKLIHVRKRGDRSHNWWWKVQITHNLQRQRQCCVAAQIKLVWAICAKHDIRNTKSIIDNPIYIMLTFHRYTVFLLHMSSFSPLSIHFVLMMTWGLINRGHWFTWWLRLPSSPNPNQMLTFINMIHHDSFGNNFLLVMIFLLIIKIQGMYFKMVAMQQCINTLRPELIKYHCADNILKSSFLWMKSLYFDSNSTMFVPECPIENKLAIR